MVKYSPLELRILSVIPKDGRKINTVEITNIVYKTNKRPRYARQSVLIAVNSLIEKSDEKKEKWEIIKSKPSSGRPVYFSIEDRLPDGPRR
jgi:hypothetical protein